MQHPEHNPRPAWAFRFAAIVLVVTVLRLAREVLMPIALAALVAFLLAPTVVRLMRWRIPKTVAIICTVTLAFVATGAIGWLVTEQAIRLGEELPSYEQNLHRKIAAIKQPHTPAAISRLATMMDKLGSDISAPVTEKSTKSDATHSEPKPVPVEVRSTHSSPVATAREILAPVFHPLATTGIVVVFAVGMLFQREDLKERFIKLVSAGHVHLANQAVEDAATRISKYLWMQLLVNAIYGVQIGLGLYFIGVPDALLWGAMATLLRFIPYAGTWLAASFPILLSIVIDPGWMKLLYTLGLFTVVEVVSVNVVEVSLYGASTGISNLALLFAAFFWTWLWGIGGLVLSTPLTVCVLVAGKYLPGMRGLNIMLGSEPVGEPPAA